MIIASGMNEAGEEHNCDAWWTPGYPDATYAACAVVNGVDRKQLFIDDGTARWAALHRWGALFGGRHVHERAAPGHPLPPGGDLCGNQNFTRFVLNHRVVLHAIDATPAPGAGSAPLDGAATSRAADGRRRCCAAWPGGATRG